MGRLNVSKANYIFCFLAGLIAGTILGTAVFTLMVSSRLEFYLEQNAYLQNELNDRQARLEKLEESVNSKNFVLKDIEIVLSFEENENNAVDIDKLDIEKNIKEKYTSLLGKEVKNIDGEVVAQIIDKRIFKIDKRHYQLQVTKLIITEILKIWVDVVELDE